MYFIYARASRTNCQVLWAETRNQALAEDIGPRRGTSRLREGLSTADALDAYRQERIEYRDALKDILAKE